jgi:hypothetical protein
MSIGWWRDATRYQIYLRNLASADGDVVSALGPTVMAVIHAAAEAS